MISEAKNKTMTSADEPTTIRAVSQIKNDYHFPGGRKYKPMNIIASNLEEATETWKSRRVPVEQEGFKEPDNNE